MGLGHDFSRPVDVRHDGSTVVVDGRVGVCAPALFVAGRKRRSASGFPVADVQALVVRASNALAVLGAIFAAFHCCNLF